MFSASPVVFPVSSSRRRLGLELGDPHPSAFYAPKSVVTRASIRVSLDSCSVCLSVSELSLGGVRRLASTSHEGAARFPREQSARRGGGSRVAEYVLSLT
jgi:hypothetical protein